MSIEALVSVTYGDVPRGTNRVSAIDVLRVLMVLAEHAGPDGADARPAQATIADVLGLERRRVRDAMGALVDQGRIIKTADAIPRQRGATYTVVCSSNGETVAGISPATVNGETRAGISPAAILILILKTPLPPLAPKIWPPRLSRMKT